jgi:hypothetical protein
VKSGTGTNSPLNSRVGVDTIRSSLSLSERSSGGYFLKQH